MLFHFYKNQSKLGVAERLYWRYYIALYLVSLIVLIPSVGIIEVVLLAWMLVDLLGGALIVLFALGFIANGLSTKMKRKLSQKA